MGDVQQGQQGQAVETGQGQDNAQDGQQTATSTGQGTTNTQAGQQGQGAEQGTVQAGQQTATNAGQGGQGQDGQENQDAGQGGQGGQQDAQDGGQQADGDPVPYHRFKEVNDQLRQARQDLERLPTLEAENMRLRVALERGIPLALAERLKGETLEDLTADADNLLAAVGTGRQQRGSPGVPPPSEGSAPEALPDFGKMSPQEIREWADKNFKR